MVNRIVLVGRLVADPEERHTNDGTVIAKFRIGVDRRRRSRDGERESDFFNVVCFRNTAEFVNRYLGRGDLVAVEGSLHIDRYTDRDGNQRDWVEVSADNVQSLGGRSDRGGGDRDRDRGRSERGGRAERNGDFPEDDEPRDRSSRGRDERDEPRERGGSRRERIEPPSEPTGGGFDDDDDDPFANE